VTALSAAAGQMEELEETIEMLTETLVALAKPFTTVWLPIQLGLIVLAALIAWGVAVLLRKRLDLTTITLGWPPVLRTLVRAVAGHLGTIAFIMLVLAMRIAMQAMTTPSRAYLLGVAASLATAWVVIGVVASVIRNKFVYRVVSISAWTIAALSIVGLLEPTTAALDSVSIAFGGLRVTPLLALKTVAMLLITLWAATAASNFLDKRVRNVSDLTPSIQVLLGKLIRIALITFAVLIVLSSVGIDFSALALFSGAVGVGVGFGLQKIVSNLVSGIILLADKSIKPGDVITVGESFGWVDTMGARYTSVVARDGREFLIPNEDFVTQKVVNWSHTNDRVRLDIKFGVSYDSDPHVVRKLAVEAAAAVPRVLATPVPACHLKAFGDSSLDFLLRFWIRDPAEGLASVRSAVMLALWDSFKREGIEIPYPVLELHLGKPVRVVVERSTDNP
jgi:small-conductance mechanosensitive channel